MRKENIHGSNHTNFALLSINYWFARYSLVSKKIPQPYNIFF